jgi:hypothetical protein
VNSPLAVAITGTGFGTNPILSITGTGVVSATPTGQSTDLSTLWATVTLNATGGTATITVTSQGYGGAGGNNFMPANTSQSPTASQTVPVTPAPVPQIMFLEQNIANNGNPSCPGASPACVFVGQQIALTAVVPEPPAGTTIQSQSWSQPSGTVVGGYIASNASGCVVLFPNTQGGGCQQPQPCQTLQNSACVTFYWVTAGTQTITYSYTLSDGSKGGATANFVVAGPTNINVNAPTSTLVIVPSPDLVSFGTDPVTSPGVQFDATATTPPPGNSGAFSWVQIVEPYQSRLLTGQAVAQVVYCTNDIFDVPKPQPVLDTSYPYATGPKTKDSPAAPLMATYQGSQVGEMAVAAQAFTMYLLWTPNAVSPCQDLGCTIPVPLASGSWGYACDAANTLQGETNGTQWSLLCPTPANNTPGKVKFSATAQHPQWASVGPAEGTSCQGLPFF